MTVSLRLEFETNGVVRIDDAVPAPMITPLRHRMTAALAGREVKSTVKLGDDPAAASLILTPLLRSAFDDLLGANAWTPPDVLEDLRVKCPSPAQPPWWHIDVFEQGPETRDGDVLSWRASLDCSGVGLLVLLLLSDVGDGDGATILRAGSHHTVARHLRDAGPRGLSLGELLSRDIATETADAQTILTTGKAGTAYLCHPLLVHNAPPNTGTAPSFWALPAIRRAL